MARWLTHRSDKNEKDIIEVLQKRGFQVKKLGQPFDLLVAKNKKWSMVEVKDPKKKGHGDEFTDAQKEFFKDWQGPDIPILRTLDDALKFEL